MTVSYSELVTQIRAYTEVDSSVLSDTIVNDFIEFAENRIFRDCLLYTSPSPRDVVPSRMPSSA